MQPRTRRVQRIRFRQPLSGRLGPAAVSVVDLSVLGARLQHDAPLHSGTHMQLSFDWEGEAIAAECRIVRSRLERTRETGSDVYHSGIEFDNVPARTRLTIRRLIEQSVRQAVQEQRTHVAAPLPHPLFAPASSANGFTCFSLESTAWIRKRTHDPGQPDEGFTISADEDDAQVDLLCEAYEKSDRDGRRLIQLFAQLSILEGEGSGAAADS